MIATAIFWGNAAFVGFTYAGYPALIGALARLRPRPVRKDPGAPLPTVTVVVCGHNEAANWPRKLETLAGLDYPQGRLDVVIVDDGSSDGTQAVLAAAAETETWRGRLRVVRLMERSGKPSGLNAGVAAARGEVILFNDARQRLNREALRELVANFADPEVGAAGGELHLEGEGGAGAYWRYEAWIRKQEGRFGSTLGVSGALYALRRELFSPIPKDTILDDMLIPLRAHLAGKRIVFEPGAHAYDQTADTRREFSRKARTLAGNFQLLTQLPALLVPWKNPSWLQFVSHKLCRLAVPFSLGGILISSVVLTPLSPIYAAALGAQLGLYVLAAVGASTGKGGKLANLSHTFVALNAAAVVGLGRFLTSRQQVTW